RRAAAELRVLGEQVEVSDCAEHPLEPLDPRKAYSPAGGALGYLDKTCVEATDRLAAGKPLLQHDHVWLESFVSEWERFSAAVRAVCPGCKVPLGIAIDGAHLMTCEALPAARHAQELEARAVARRGEDHTPAAWLCADTDRLAIALATLVDANQAY